MNLDFTAAFKRFLFLGHCNHIYKSSKSYSEQKGAAKESLIDAELKKLSSLISKIDDKAIIFSSIRKAVETGLSCNKSAALQALAICAATFHSEAYACLLDLFIEAQHILEFIDYSYKIALSSTAESKMPDWTNTRKHAIQQWYSNKRPYDVAFSVSSCFSLNRWNHKDVLRLCHIRPHNSLCMEMLCTFIAKGYNKVKAQYGERVAESNDPDAYSLIRLLDTLHEVKHSKSAEDVSSLFSEHNLNLNHLPCRWYNDVQIWKHLISQVPLQDLMKNLSRLHSIKVLEKNNLWCKIVAQRFMDFEAVKNSGLHPYSFFLHRHHYAKGEYLKKKYKWEPDMQILSSLNAAFYASIKNATPTHKRINVTVDASDSMKGYVIGDRSNSLTCQMVSAAMCFILSGVEENVTLKGFSKTLEKIDISKTDAVEAVTAKIGKISLGGTDCARPMITAKKNSEKVDAFIILTDKRTCNGKTSPEDALVQYQNKMNLPEARLIVVSLKSNGSEVKCKERGILDICGFDEKVPLLINDFISGRF